MKILYIINHLALSNTQIIVRSILLTKSEG